ncbi:MAG: cupin domain-containing protein [Rikenellaceae bacterium]|jgi:quercetin dioxygenase-like cupin family protein|nr:cupin domain-containing protein [Rikenellaceae bacterium]
MDKYTSDTFQTEATGSWQTIEPGVRRQIMGYDDRLMLVKVAFEAGVRGALHAHPHSQASVVLSGVFEATVDGETRMLRAGEGFYAAPNRMHGVSCLEAGTIMDTFSPAREDFLK